MPEFRKLENAPLVHVLAQVRFSPLLNIGEHVPSIQQDLKKLGFIRFEKSQVQNVLLASGSAPRVDTAERWDFLTREKRTGVILTSGFVVLQTSEYNTFNDFGAILLDVLQSLAQEADIDIVERLGIRYVNVIRPREEEDFATYLKPGLVGFPFSEIDNAEFQRTFSNMQSLGQTTDGATLVARCLQLNNGQFLPPDLVPSGLTYDVKLTPEELIAILDFDHYRSVDMDLDPATLVERLDELHQVAKRAFQHAVTDEAIDIWQGAS